MNDDRMLLKVVFAVVVVLGWLASMLWLVWGVSQIAVEHTMTDTTGTSGEQRPVAVGTPWP